MDYFFQEQRWTDTFLSLHVKKFKRIILFLLIAFSAAGAKAAEVPTSWKDVTFNENIRYSQWVINSRISDFYANQTQRGFYTYDKNGTETGKSKGDLAFDYVPGLVAKAVLEAYANYSTFDWSKPWFYSVMNYAKEKTYTLVATSKATDFSKITLDNMNACKMYFPLMETGALSDGAKSTGETAIANVLTDMKKYNELYVIGNGSESGVKNSTNETVKSMFGGWFHKPSYKDQMWCDGLYMGAALLAQIVNYTKSTTNVDKTSDWNLITKQFTISWNQLYDSKKGLLYHAFTANPKDNASSAWAGISNTSGSEVYHSEAFWGRAMGWYFLALVDVLEQMPLNNSNRATLIGYLEQLAAGLAQYQDGTGCWYQVVDQKDKALSGNYLESSCTSLFAAAYLKAVRLGFLTTNGTYDYKTIGVNAFKGAVKQFMKYDTFEPTGTTVQLVHNCASAGLGGDKKRSGSREYYITGGDVGQTNTYTEGKVLGAFIMAATEYERLNPKDIRFSYDLAPSYTLAQGGSIKAEALGSGTITYQWCKSDGSEVSGATSETFTPAESGSYYCKATSGNTTIQTSTTAVTVEAASNENGGSNGKKVLFSTDFTEEAWTGVTTTSETTSTTATINGTQVTLKGFAYNTGFSVSNGTMTFPGNNMSEKNYYIAIPVSGVNDSITIEFGGTDNYKYYYDICSSTETPNRTKTNEVSNGVVTITESYSGTDAIIYIGRSSSNYKTISSIKITTPSSSTPTGYTVTATAANGTVTITDGSGNTIESGSQVNYGTKLVFTATANSGYEFSSWSVNGTTGTESGATYTIASLTKATSVTATFTKTSSGGGNNDQPTYVYKVDKAGLPAPAINSSKYITTKNDETGETGEKLVKMTFGGWKWNKGKYIRPETKQEITDSWKDSETVSGVTVLDGYQYWFSGTQDAKQENKDAETEMYGQIRNGWFVSPTRENGITTDSHPYTLPVRGSFMTFEPTMNGTLTIYILQNGVWNSDTEHNIDIKPGEFRMHAFQITNQRGLVLAEFAPKYSVTNNQKVKTGYSCSKCLDTEKPTSFDKTSKDVSDWEEFWALSEAERKAVHDSWFDPENNGCQKIIKLENGSFLAIQKAVVKYQFHVTGNETYYLFSNFSKMGFSGATFQPDADSGQPTDVATFSGDNSLSDTKAYTEITMTEDGKIGDTGLTNYKYTIGGKEVGKVTGVFIPQFKKITLNRTFKKDQWTTLSLPFNLTQTEVEQIFGKGTQIIVFDKAKITSARTYLTFFYHEIQNVLPGYPYLIRPTLVDADGKQMVTKSNSADYAPTYTINTEGKLTEFTVYNKAINPAIKPHEFKSGDYTAKCTPSYCAPGVNNTNYSILYGEDDIFVSEKDGTVYISEGKSYGKGYRSYIDYTGTTAPAKALSISFSGVEDDDDNGTTTDIRIAELADDVIETLGIGGVYNLNGQKVADTTRNLPAGIYIVNGRKVVVK